MHPESIEASTSSAQPQTNIFQILPVDIIAALQAQASPISAQGIAEQVFIFS